MQVNAKLNDGTIVKQYGLGLGLTPYKGRKRFGHNGGGPGFSTAFTYFPAERVSVVILANAEQPEGRIGAMANEIAEFYF
jgi:CubicO group peptidase (beta-lactamase class C family)